MYCGLSGESDHLRYSANSSFGPVIVYNCTARCNLNCVHCYSSSGPTAAADELTTGQAKKLLTDIAEANCPVLLFSGGEPLMREDLFELLAEAKKLSLRTVVSTNGTLIDLQTAKKLAAVGVSYVGVSIDGEEQFHDAFRRSQGSFKAAINGLEHCNQAGIKTGLRFTITKANCGQIPAVFEIAAAAGVRRICFYHLIRSGRAENLDGQAPSVEQTREVLDTIVQKTVDFTARGLVDEVLTVDNHADGPYLLMKMKSESSPRYDEARRLLLANGGNKVGEKIACVGWNGEVYPDQFWRNYSPGNIRDRSLRQIWENAGDPALSRLRNKEQHRAPKCRLCNWFDLCKGNYRFLGGDPGENNWLNEPACYLTDEEIRNSKLENQNAK
jgi:radical SAM protein with 4Fe4S-binding SPASM domain